MRPVVKLSPLGAGVLRDATTRHPLPWRCEGPRLLDARGAEVLRLDGDAAGAALVLEVVASVVLPMVNRNGSEVFHA